MANPAEAFASEIRDAPAARTRPLPSACIASGKFQHSWTSQTGVSIRTGGPR